MTKPGDRFLPIVIEEIETMRQLLALMQTEREHLVAADTDRLAGTTEQKDLALKRLSELGANRHAALTAAGVGLVPAELETWVASQHPDIRARWADLLVLAAEAKEINRVNGLLIARKLTLNQSERNVLSGNSKSTNLYGPDGQSTAAGTSRSFAAG